MRGVPYVMRLTARADQRSDPARQIAYAKSAAEAGIAPRVWYANAAEGILITDFVESRPLGEDAGVRIAAVIRTLQTLPGWPSKMGYFEVVEGFVTRFRLAQLVPEALVLELCGRYDAAARVYPRRVMDLAVAHNDLKADNILFDGERVWLVDWESAFLNDRYVDLAVAANFFVRNDAQESDFLSAYFDRPASDYERARFYLMRQIVHTFAAAFCVTLAAGRGERFVPVTPPEEFDAFHQALIERTVDLAAADALMRYGQVHLERAVRNGRTQRFADSIALVSAAA